MIRNLYLSFAVKAPEGEPCGDCYGSGDGPNGHVCPICHGAGVLVGEEEEGDPNDLYDERRDSQEWGPEHDL